MISQIRSLPLTPYEASRPSTHVRLELSCDRPRCADVDDVVQVVCYVISPNVVDPGNVAHVFCDGTLVATYPAVIKSTFHIDPRALELGSHEFKVEVRTAAGALVASTPAMPVVKFEAPMPAPAPERIRLSVTAEGRFSGRTVVNAGVSLPPGFARSVEGLRLLEDGRAIPAQFVVRGRHSAKANAWISWVGIVFTGFAEADVDYELERIPSIDLVEDTFQTPNTIVVDTGPLRATFMSTVPAPAFEVDGVNMSAEGPRIVDHNGVVYFGKPLTMKVEERGPIRTTVFVAGNFETPEGSTWHRFETRYRFVAGVRRVEVEHVVVLTEATKDRPIADIRFDQPIGGDAQSAMYAIDGEPETHAVPAFYVQSKASLKFDGWMAATHAGGAVLAALLDMKERYPAELGVEGDVLSVHLWPKHGTNVFTDGLDRNRIHLLRFAHQGPLLDLTVPQIYLDRLAEFDAAENWDVEDSIAAAALETGVGVRISGLFAFDFFSPARADASEFAESAEVWFAQAHAISEEKLAEAASTIEPVTDAVQVQFAFLADWLRAKAARTDEFGRFIYGNTNNDWYLDLDRPSLHRLWQNSHYQHVDLAGEVYEMMAIPETLELWRRMVTQFLDTGILPAGGQRHCKAYVPWAKQEGVIFHWVDVETLVRRFRHVGCARTKDAIDGWFRTLSSINAPRSDGREAVAQFAATLAYYLSTWDPEAITHIRAQLDVLLRRSFLLWSNRQFPVWSVWWLKGAYELTRDPRAIPLALEYIDWKGELSFAAFLLEHAPDEYKAEVIRKTDPFFWNLLETVYLDPGSPHHGYSPNYGAAVEWRNLRAARLYSQARHRVASYVPASHEIEYPILGPSNPGAGSATLLAPGNILSVRFKPIDQADKYVAGVKIDAPNGATVFNTTSSATPALFTNTFEFTAPGDRLWRTTLTGARPLFVAPLTNGVEAMMLPKFARVVRFRGWIGVPEGHSITLEFQASPSVSMTSAPVPIQAGTIVIDGDEKHVLLVARQTVSYALSAPAGSGVKMWPIEVYAGGSHPLHAAFLRWTGSAPWVLLGLEADHVWQIAAQLALGK